MIAIACGVSSAISTAFNAPIAGVIFAHEVILRHYSIRAFAAVALFYMRGVLLSGKLAGKLKLPLWAKPPLAGLALGLVCLAVP